MAGDSVQAYPLAWPAGWPRSEAPKRSQFGRGSTRSRWTDGQGREQVAYSSNAHTIRGSIVALGRELERLGAVNVTVSSNLRLKIDGEPYSGQKEPADPGVAVYFALPDETGAPRAQVLACDRWDRAADNLWAIAKHIEALRGMERWGVGSVAKAFAGYAALPERAGGKPPLQVLGLPIDRPATRAAIESAFRIRARECHPDAGGDPETWHELVAAKEAALAGAA